MRFAALFGDHAVLQREIPIPVWGWISPSTRVSVTLGNERTESMSGIDGKFLVRFPAMSAGGPYELTATDLKTGEKITSTDIYVGEVWVASGQSNMQFRLFLAGEGGLRESMSTNLPKFRHYTVPCRTQAVKQQDSSSQWRIADPENSKFFSAVAYYFGKELSTELDVPVGIICNAIGGTIIEAWMSRKILMKNPYTRDLVMRTDSDTFSPEFWARYSTKDLNRLGSRDTLQRNLDFIDDPGNIGEGKGWAMPDFDDSDWELILLPGSWKQRGLLFNGSVWFRRLVYIPESWSEKNLTVNLGAVDKHDITYFNGIKIGALGEKLDDSYYNTPREYKIPGNLVKPGYNLIACRAYSYAFDGGLIGPESLMKIYPDGFENEAHTLCGEWRCKVEHNIGNVTKMTPLDPGPGCCNTAHILFDNMINSLLPFAIRGVIWYQGESNADGNADQYLRMMKDLIWDWRYHWGQGDFPFLMVQLANFRKPEVYQETSNWAVIREAQMKSLEVPNVGMATAIDIGDENDVHPINKRDVGLRLSRWALKLAYNKNLIVSGPLFDSATIGKNTIRIQFKHVGGGLEAKGGELRTFMIAGKDKVFHQAIAEIDEESVVVHCPEVKAPVAVRYAWADNPEEANLYNQEGFPTSPFRTDSW